MIGIQSASKNVKEERIKTRIFTCGWVVVNNEVTYRIGK